MSSEILVTRPGDQGVVATAPGLRTGTPRPKTAKKEGGRRRRGHKTRRSRRHRGGGKITVVQDGAVWRLKENLDDGTTQVSSQTWSSADAAMQLAKTLKSIKELTPDQGERRAVAVAGQALASMKSGRRRH